jgi:hypothetical protein
MPFHEPINAAIDKAIDAAVFINLVGELGALINEAAGSAQIPDDEAIDKAAASAQMLADKATDMSVNAAVLVKWGGGVGGNPYPPSAQEPVDKADSYPEDAAALV